MNADQLVLPSPKDFVGVFRLADGSWGASVSGNTRLGFRSAVAALAALELVDGGRLLALRC